MKRSKWLASLVGVLSFCFVTKALGTTTTVPVPAIPIDEPRDVGNRSGLEQRAIEEAKRMGGGSETMIVARGYVEPAKINRFKLFDPVNKRAFGVSFDERGNLISESQAEAAVRAVVSSGFVGKISKELYGKIEKASETETLYADVWVEDKGLPPIEKDLAKYQSSFEARKRALKALLDERIKELEAEGVVIVVRSELAPLIVVQATKKQLERISELPKVDSLLLPTDPKKTKVSLDSAAPTHNATGMWNAGWTGTGVKIAVWENSPIRPDHQYLGSVVKRQNITGSSHPTKVAGVIASTHPTYKGIAYNVARPLYAANYGQGGPIWQALEWAVNQGANVINSSEGAPFACNEPGNSMLTEERYMDYVVKNYYRTITVAAGNNGNAPSVPNKPESRGCLDHWAYSYNSIAVGSFYDNNTGSWPDDRFTISSSWKEGVLNNPHGDLAKPDLVAVGVQVETTGCYEGQSTDCMDTGSGTSISAPMVAGGSALLMHKASWLKLWPEVVKALMLAGSLETFPTNDPPDIPAECSGNDHIYRKECFGSGGPEFGTMSKVLDSTGCSSGRCYDYGYKAAGAGSWAYTFNVTTVNDWISVAFVWDASTSGGVPPTSSYLNADFDMFIQSPSGWSWSSASYDNPSEVIEFYAPETGTYTVTINPYRFDAGTNTYYGYAAWRGWSP